MMTKKEKTLLIDSLTTLLDTGEVFIPVPQSRSATALVLDVVSALRVRGRGRTRVAIDLDRTGTEGTTFILMSRQRFLGEQVGTCEPSEEFLHLLDQ